MNQSDSPPRLRLTLAEVVDAFRRVRAIDAALEAHELTAFDLSLLASIVDDPEATAAALAKQLGVTHSAASNGIDRLQARGLVQRRGRSFSEPGGDRRIAPVVVTEPGRAVLATLSEIEVKL